MKCFLTISPREGSAPCAASSAISGTGSSCHFDTANSTKRKFDDANYDKEKRENIPGPVVWRILLAELHQW